MRLGSSRDGLSEDVFRQSARNPVFHEHRVHMRPDCDPAARGLHAQALVQVWIEFDGLGFSLHRDGGLQTRRESASTKFRNNVLTPAAAPCERRGRMKLRITLKDPDGVYESIRDAAKKSANEIYGLSASERDSLVDSRIASIERDCAKWITDGEYVTIEIDTDAGTATVIPV